MIEKDLHVAAKATEHATYLTGTGTAVGGIMGWLNEYGIAIGAICAVVTMLANLYFKHKELKLKERALNEKTRRT